MKITHPRNEMLNYVKKYKPAKCSNHLAFNIKCRQKHTMLGFGSDTTIQQERAIIYHNDKISQYTADIPYQQINRDLMMTRRALVEKLSVITLSRKMRKIIGNNPT